MMAFVYPARFRQDPAGGHVVTFRDLPEAITAGESAVECVEAAAGALQAAVEGRILDGLDIPAASLARRGERMIAVPVQTALKAALYIAMRRAGVSRTELARRLGMDEREARRMLDPHHPSKAGRLERALAALGRQVELSIT